MNRTFEEIEGEKQKRCGVCGHFPHTGECPAAWQADVLISPAGFWGSEVRTREWRYCHCPLRGAII